MIRIMLGGVAIMGLCGFIFYSTATIPGPPSSTACTTAITASGGNGFFALAPNGFIRGIGGC